jgi:hypothetical protein
VPLLRSGPPCLATINRRAFIGSGEIGVWVSNGERDAFLDWFAAHRCALHDARWEYCMSEAHRWSGCCLELRYLIPCGEVFVISETEYAEAGAEFWPHVAQLLCVISRITRGEWQHLNGSGETHVWRDVVRPLEFNATECGFQDGLGGASVGAGTNNYHYVVCGRRTEDRHPEFNGVYFEFDNPRNGVGDLVKSVVVGDQVVEFQLKDHRRIVVKRGMDELQWSTFLRGIHDAFQDDII